MKILFVWPNGAGFGVKPIGISLLIAILRRAGHEVELFDTSFIDLGGADYSDDLTKNGYFKPVNWNCDVSKSKISLEDSFTFKVKDFRPDIVAISVLIDEVKTANKIMAICNSMNIPVIIGNKGVSKIIPYCNCSIFHGEAIETLLPFLANKIMNFVQYPSGYYRNLDALPYLDWSDYDSRHFLKAYDGKVYRGGDHMIGWGCINSCSYCINEHWRDIHGGMRGCIRMYSVDRMIDELVCLKSKYHLEFFKFHDEDFLLKPKKYLREFAIKYKEWVRLPFTCMTNALSVDSEKAKLLSDMGCVSVSMGIETGDPVMRQILRRRENGSDLWSANRLLCNNGIRVSSFNMIGLPFETTNTIKATIRLNREVGIEYPNISFYMPLEGTLLYTLSVKYGFYNPIENKELRTDRPSLKLPGINEMDLLYYYVNFYNLVTE